MIINSQVEAFRAEVARTGLVLPASVPPNQLIRFPGIGKSNSNTSGWAWLSEDGLGGAYGDWASGLSETWHAQHDHVMTVSERAERTLRVAKLRRIRQAEEAHQHAAAAQRAQAVWSQAAPAPADHSYLMRKQVQPHDLRVDAENRLIVPVMIDGTIASLQTIDVNGGKLFLPGGKVHGGSFIISAFSQANPLLLCEGFATGASLYEATGLPVVVAFSAGNLTPVAEQLRQQFPTAAIILCGDHDLSGTGQREARKAADAVRGVVVLPEEPGQDFNDVRTQQGSDAVRLAVEAAIQGEDDLLSLPALSALSVRDQDDWPEPAPIKTALLPVEPLPLAIIPAPFRPWINDVADRMQCPPDFVAAAMLVMTSSIIGAGCAIRPKQQDDWQVTPNLWGGVVGRPSMMKTPAIGEAMKPMDKLSSDAKLVFDEVQKGYLADCEGFKANREAIVDKMRKAAKDSRAKAEKTPKEEGALSPPTMDALKQNLTALEAPTPPVWRRYKTNDATIEKMGELQALNPRGLMLFRDELVGLFATWDKADHEADRAFYLESWNGDKPYTCDRIGRGTTHVDNLCVALFGGIQPMKLTRYLHAAMRGLNNDGLVQRLQMLVYPDERVDWTLVDRPIHAQAKQDAFVAVARLATMDFRQVGAFAEEGQTPYFRFTDEAQAVFNAWLTELEIKLRADEEPVLQEHLGKYRSLMPSLALQFHLLNLAHTPGVNGGPVSKECAEQAAAWCEYLESHARRIYGLITSATAQAAAQLAKRLTKGELPERFTVREVYRKGWSLLGDNEMARNACEELVSLGWLRELVTPPAQGQKRQTEYLTSPKVRG